MIATNKICTFLRKGREKSRLSHRSVTRLNSMFNLLIVFQKFIDTQFLPLAVLPWNISIELHLNTKNNLQM